MKPIRIFLADDHTIVRDGLKALLEQDDLCRVIAQAGDGMEAIAKAQELPLDLAIVDLSMPRLNGLEVVRRLAESLPELRILVLTHHHEPEYVLPLVRAGAHGYLVKDTPGEELRRAVECVASGGSVFGPQAAAALARAQREPRDQAIEDPYQSLTAREREVMHLVCEGKSTKEVARTLGIGVKTAENHRGRVLDKLDVRNTAELVRYAARRGLID
ncbi:response regulator transcription factor [Wenzhouxiangella sp. XN201]|uniref:response regulator n=1 Tax=Wenzhouxiangella sp. XN201 TaxID=2710755 RepID=UPI0013C913EA|nr:response regulator transcription factor [Wenzhouxiangella sp. XN201]NEZ04826.1 response regulator transcription factor [Wenzhouxiangella sp. XN201]